MSDTTIEQEKRRRIAELYPEMIRRTEVLKGVLARMIVGEDVPDHRFDLAREDLMAVLKAMMPDEQDEGDDPDAN